MNPFMRDLLSALGREVHETGMRALRAGAAEVLDDIDDRLSGGLGRVRTAREKVAGSPRTSSGEGKLRKAKKSSSKQRRKSEIDVVVVDAEIIEDE